MTQTLSFKIALAFLIVSLAGIGLIAAMVAVLTTETFGAYVDAEHKGEVAFELEHYYTAHGSWEGVDQPVHWPIGPSVHPAQPEFALLSTSGSVLIAGHNLIMGEAADPALLEHAVPIRVDGEVVGYFLPSEEDFGARPPAAAFLQPFYQALGMGALAAFGASLILGIAAAETITRPVRELTDATQAVAAGDLEHRVRVHSRDELGELAEAFNRMATDLLASRSQRRQMTADIALVLRTPLSLILGHGEALSEGVLPATPETLHIIYDEAQR
ncbi:MAG: HAMP domain-containing protein, partial [Anaerolineae bacterium]